MPLSRVSILFHNKSPLSMSIINHERKLNLTKQCSYVAHSFFSYSLPEGVLDESEDTLLNPNLVEVEKASKNVEMKKGKPGYNPYEDEEVDEFGNVS